MQIKFLKQIVEHVAGTSAVTIVDLLSTKKDINEFLIAKKLKLTINQTRNLLYRLSHLGILSSIRKKDKRKGWYIYFWTLNILRSLELLEENLSKEISQLETQFKDKQSKRFYKCKLCGRELTEDSALLTDFICAECGEVYELADHSNYLLSLTKNISRLKKELELIKYEREKEQAKQHGKLKRVIKRVETEKKKKRAKARIKTKRQKARLIRKSEKLKINRQKARLIRKSEKLKINRQKARLIRKLEKLKKNKKARRKKQRK